jgi:hypothetical protein
MINAAVSRDREMLYRHRFYDDLCGTTGYANAEWQIDFDDLKQIFGTTIQ